jgi:hypothetical protein
MSESDLTPEAVALLKEVGAVSVEIGLLGEASGDLRAYRIELCRRAKAAGITTNALGAAAGVSGPAVTQWLQSAVPA